MSAPTCRLCGSLLRHTFVDLGMSPLCETFLTADELDRVEHFYPLHVRICESCLLVQLEAYVPANEIFQEYAYFSAYSDSWVAHARTYAEQMIERFGLGKDSFVVELASNDGYLLQHFVEHEVPVLGIDPAANVAEAAEARGVETLVEFFDSALARALVAEGRRADLIAANNVLAQVPQLNDFVAGIEILLAPGGVATIEVPHLARLVEGLQFDTIYHEHYSYFSLTTLVALASRHGLELFDVQELPSHGGSLRVFLRRPGEGSEPSSGEVARVIAEEQAAGYDTLDGYREFGERVAAAKWSLLELLIGLRRSGKTVVGYGAPGKGNTLLNYCGIRTDLLDYTVDRNPYKHGRFLPGTHIPIHPPQRIDETKPDYVLILPWNLRKEISAQLSHIRDWGAELIVPIPEPEILRWPDDRHGSGGMKVVIFCGGLGLRMGETSARIPKPMIAIGDKPILWHIMNYYASFGITEFILCLGYKAEVIKEYFLNYNEALSNDFILSDGGKRVDLLRRDIHDWSVTFVDTGLNAPIGQRLAKVQPFLEDDDVFLATYGDGLTDAPLLDMIERLKGTDAVGLFLASHPRINFHIVAFDGDSRVRELHDVTASGLWLNAGYFVFRREIFDYIQAGEDLVEEPFQRLIGEERLFAYPYEGFWAPMDTLKDKHVLETLLETGEAPWRTPQGVPASAGAAGA